MSLDDVTDSHMATIDTSTDDVFCAHVSESNTRYGLTADRMNSVNGYDRNIVSWSE